MNAADWNARDAIKALVLAHVGPLAVIGAVSLCAGSVVWALHQRDEANVARGQAVERARVADSTILAWAPLLHKADTLIVRDTVRVRVTTARVDSLRDSVLIHDTTYVVREYVAAVDATVKACRETASDCALFRQSATRLLSAKDDKIRALESIKPRPSLLHDLTRFAVGVGVGYLIPRHK